MIRSAVTVSLVPEARGGPFVFWDDLAVACREASALGFDAVEIFAPSSTAVDRAELRRLLDEHSLQVAAVGTGAGMVKHKLSLTSPHAAERSRAVAFVQEMIDFGGEFGAPAIIGSMQGRWGSELDKTAALTYLGDALATLGGYARQYGMPLIYEPLNRYETNLLNTLGDAAAFLESSAIDNVKLLADLFHANIEEIDIAAALRATSTDVGHIHFVDSNRRAAGMGHLDYEPIAAALREINYNGYASAEVLSYPDARTAAEQTMNMFRKYFR